MTTRGLINTCLNMIYEFKRYDKAIAFCNEAIRRDPDSAEIDGAYFVRGLAYNGLAQYDKAIAEFTEAIRLLGGLGIKNWPSGFRNGFKRAVRKTQRTRGTGSLGCRAKRKIRSQQKLAYQLASRAANQPVRIPSACALDLLRFDVGYRKNLRRIVQELTETIFGAALSRPQRPISRLCRSSFSASLFPNRLAVSH